MCVALHAASCGACALIKRIAYAIGEPVLAITLRDPLDKGWIHQTGDALRRTLRCRAPFEFHSYGVSIRRGCACAARIPELLVDNRDP